MQVARKTFEDQFRPFRALASSPFLGPAQGEALGYVIPPRWGLLIETPFFVKHPVVLTSQYTSVQRGRGHTQPSSTPA